jgi:hypothetical protein
VRLLALLLSLGLAHPVAAQPAPKKKAQKQLVHKKPTPEQIRKFNALAKKKQNKD